MKFRSKFLGTSLALIACMIAQPALAKVSLSASLAGNVTESYTDKEVKAKSIHANLGVYAGSEKNGTQSIGLELTYRNIQFTEQDDKNTFDFESTAPGILVRVIPSAGFSVAFGLLNHDIKAKYTPEIPIKSNTIQDGKLSGTFLSLGLMLPIYMVHPYLDYTRYWLPKFGSKIDEFSFGFRIHHNIL